MAKAEASPKDTPESSKGESSKVESSKGGNSPEAASPPAARQPVAINDENAISCYANFCRVTGTPEELILDFGLNTQPFGPQTEAVKVTQRIVTNFYTAKRMMHALQLTLQRHEAAFGVLETDVQKRVVPTARQAPPPPAQSGPAK